MKREWDGRSHTAVLQSWDPGYAAQAPGETNERNDLPEVAVLLENSEKGL